MYNIQMALALHKFPRDGVQRQEWTDFVRTCRSYFGSAYMKHQVKTYISERHFTPDCYPVSCCYYAKFNIQRKDKKLNPGAVPTIQKLLFSQQLNRWKYFNCNLCDCGFISDIIWHINNSSIYSSTCHTPARLQHCQGWL